MSAYCGKLAIVTGSAVGIGSAIAKRFVTGGLTVRTQSFSFSTSSISNTIFFCQNVLGSWIRYTR